MKRTVLDEFSISRFPMKDWRAVYGWILRRNLSPEVVYEWHRNSVSTGNGTHIPLSWWGK